MKASRLRTGEILAGTGAAGLFVLLFFDWFESPAVRLAAGFRPVAALNTTGWGSLGWFLIVLLILLIVGALTLVVTTTRGEPVALPVAAAVVTAFFGIFVFAVLLLRVLTQPGLGVDAPNHLVEIRPAAYLGLLCALVTAAGAWLAISDERTDAPESAYEPPPARPAPPAEAETASGA